VEIDPQLQQLIDAVEDSMDCDAWGYHGHDQNNAQRKAIAEAVNARLLPEDARSMRGQDSRRACRHDQRWGAG